MGIKVIKKFDRFLRTTQKRKNLLGGGAGSGKSKGIAIHFCRTFLSDQRNLTLGAWRKTKPSVRVSCFKVVKETLRSWGYTVGSGPNYHVQCNETTMELHYGTNTFMFLGIDDPEKIKSVEFDMAWIEEATELELNDFNTINRCLRGGKIDKVFCSYNPVDAFAWPVLLAQSADPDMAFHHSTFEDNPFLPQAVKDEIDKYKDTDDQLYRIYRLGLPGVLENIIYSNYKILGNALWHQYIRERIDDPDYRGLDFGFDTCAMVDVWFFEGQVYLRERFYEHGWHTGHLKEWLGDEDNKIDASIEIIADAARPDIIQELNEAGYHVTGCKKGPGSVIEGINIMRQQKLIVDAESEELAKELRNYKRKKTKDGHVLEQPVKAFDHLMDATRYVIMTKFRIAEQGDREELTDEDAYIESNCPSIF
jgi:phage terminase large subunit